MAEEIANTQTYIHTQPSNLYTNYLENFTFQVLSPDDVAFRLPTIQNFNDSTIEKTKEWTPDYSICVTLTNTSGILFLTFMAIIVISLTTSAIITWRRCMLKRRKYGNKMSKVVMSKMSKFEVTKTAVPMPPKKILEQKSGGSTENSKSRTTDNSKSKTEISKSKK